MIITALAAMIAVAGYLNYSGTRLDESLLNANSTAVEDVEDAGLAEDISAEDLYAETGEDEYADIESLDGDVDLAEENVGEAVLASSTMGVGLVSEAKVTREQTRSRNKEMLMELINSTNITDDQKQSAIDEMVQMTDVAEKELAAETLLVAQGFDEVVVSINDSCADVVVSSTQVSDSQRAQIEDIVKRKTGIEAANITITPVVSSE
ncbi:MAG: SpoIIIAH-like family protein [Lachnospiraceae bacterium]|nr:SpoIIIAH-like family protein [Lachnospiraceae bacterium]